MPLEYAVAVCLISCIKLSAGPFIHPFYLFLKGEQNVCVNVFFFFFKD